MRERERTECAESVQLSVTQTWLQSTTVCRLALDFCHRNVWSENEWELDSDRPDLVNTILFTEWISSNELEEPRMIDWVGSRVEMLWLWTVTATAFLVQASRIKYKLSYYYLLIKKSRNCKHFRRNTTRGNGEIIDAIQHIIRSNSREESGIRDRLLDLLNDDGNFQLTMTSWPKYCVSRRL